ncbi:MAG TPA: UDP-N-acetylmuramoyl-tripeptide--D-alanyl-D-alanine ligase [Acidimicrobiales bacterium]|nr:UDP-N-acetylmuramoyl-tripeptide--D-alanyl-D-alanine ligase [Acidimicrobiales bacterium]
MELRTSDVARVTGGRAEGPDVTVDGAAIDSRSVGGRELFVPIVAERDGHDFVPAAVAGGAPAYLTHRGPLPGAQATAVTVADTTAAFEALARHARSLLPDRVVGVTGSVGKTSVKDLLAAVLAERWRTSASVRSFNNELGVPLTLLNAPTGTEALVVEMGARGVGHVKALCDLAAPTVGVVTRVAAVHTELFGTIDDVARAKGELVEALPTTGVAVLNADDPRVAAMANRTPARVLTFGLEPAGGRRAGAARPAGSAGAAAPADVRAEDVRLDGDLRPRFRLVTPDGTAEVSLEVRGIHMVGNALAAAAAALACDVAVDAVAAGLAAARLSPWRMELGVLPSGARVLNDAYNANPTSMAAALRALAALPGRRRVAVLGVMAELGPAAAQEHKAVGALARDLGIEIVAVGTGDYGGAVVAGDEPAAVAAALGPLSDGDVVLLKGSRVAGLERVAALLAGD